MSLQYVMVTWLTHGDGVEGRRGGGGGGGGVGGVKCLGQASVGEH